MDREKLLDVLGVAAELKSERTMERLGMSEEDTNFLVHNMVLIAAEEGMEARGPEGVLMLLKVCFFAGLDLGFTLHDHGLLGDPQYEVGNEETDRERLSG